MQRDLVLALDTATERLSVGVLRPARASDSSFDVLGHRDTVAGRDTSRLLLPSAEGALADAGGTVADVGAVVVGVGPGTFTGIRIAVAAARAIGLALDLPVLGVPTLSALVASVADSSPNPELDSLTAVVDARRGQVFVGVYERDVRGLWVRRRPYRAASPADLPAETRSGEHQRGSALVGEGDALQLVTEGATSGGSTGGGPLFGWAAVLETPVSASFLVKGQDRLAEPPGAPVGRRLGPWLNAMLSEGWNGLSPDRRRPGEPGTPEAVVPLYVRAPDADEHITRMRDPFAS